MNTEPQFTDYRGRKMKPVTAPLQPHEWSRKRFFLAGILIILVPLATFAAVTQINLTTQVQGILPTGNGGIGASASAFTGIMRWATGTASASELSGDATTSGSNAVTVAKVNGTSVTTNSAADQALITTASATGAWASIPNCPSGALQYTTSTHTFACGTVLTGTFADAETPSGTINSSNVTFTLAHTPNPSADLNCFENGVQQRAGGQDYTLATATITYGAAPLTGSTLICFYRY